MMRIVKFVVTALVVIVAATFWDAVTQDANAMAPGTPGGYSDWAARRANRPTTHPTQKNQHPAPKTKQPKTKN